MALVCLVALTFSTSGQVVINEVACSNEKSVEYPPDSGKYPDWVELYNVGNATANLVNMSLVFTNAQETNRFFFTQNTYIDPQTYLLIWFDSETNALGTHTLYKLPQNDGGNLQLVAPDGITVVSDVREAQVPGFGLQITDLTIGRIPSGTGLFTLTVPTPALENVAQELGGIQNLRLNEWMATNSAGDDKDWIEMYNKDVYPVNLGNLVVSDSVPPPGGHRAILPLSFIGSNAFIRFWCDGSPRKGVDHLNFGLSSSSGEANVSIFLPDRVNYVDRISFGAQVRNTTEGRLPDGSDTIVRPLIKDTPGESNFQPLQSIVINEVLTHTDPPLEDAIELYNPTDTNVVIGYWWLSNRKNDAKKFQIPPGITLGPREYIVFYEQSSSTGGFNTSGTGNAPDFTLNSSQGDEVYLTTADSAGNLTGYRRGIDFGAAFNGVSFGRYVLSNGDVDITALNARTFGHDNPVSVFDFRQGMGKTNAYPVVGPVVINEIMYKPINLNGTNDNSIDEYIELHNITTTNVPLFSSQVSNAFVGGPDIPFTSSWQVDDEIKYTFPNITLSPNGYLLVVNFDPVTNTTQLADFKSKFNIPGSFTNIFGPYKGKLKNSSASIKLLAPDNVQSLAHPDAGLVPVVRVDRVNYRDEAPWPTQPDGFGASLQRRNRAQYGNDPNNWGALSPTPGRTNVFTPPLVQVDSVTRLGILLDIAFTATAGQPYAVEQKPALVPGVWTTLTNIIVSSPGSVHAYDTNNDVRRFYRVRTPTTP